MRGGFDPLCEPFTSISPGSPINKDCSRRLSEKPCCQDVKDSRGRAPSWFLGLSGLHGYRGPRPDGTPLGSPEGPCGDRSLLDGSWRPEGAVGMLQKVLPQPFQSAFNPSGSGARVFGFPNPLTSSDLFVYVSALRFLRVAAFACKLFHTSLYFPALLHTCSGQNVVSICQPIGPNTECMTAICPKAVGPLRRIF